MATTAPAQVDDLPARLFEALRALEQAKPSRLQAEQKARTTYDERLESLRMRAQSAATRAEAEHASAQAAAHAEHERVKPLLSAIEQLEQTAIQALRAASIPEPAEAGLVPRSDDPANRRPYERVAALHTEAKAAYAELGDRLLKLARAKLRSGLLEQARRMIVPLSGLNEGNIVGRARGLLADVDCRAAELALRSSDWEDARRQLEFPLSVADPRGLPLLRKSYLQPASLALKQNDWQQARALLDTWRDQARGADQELLDLASEVYTQLVWAPLATEHEDLHAALRVWNQFRASYGAQQRVDELTTKLLAMARVKFEAGFYEHARRIAELLSHHSDAQIQRAARELQLQVYYRAAELALDASGWDKARAYLETSLRLENALGTAPAYRRAKSLLRETYLRPVRIAAQQGNWQEAQALVDAAREKLGSDDAELGTLAGTIYETLAGQYSQANNWEQVYQTWHRYWRVTKNLNMLAFEALRKLGDAAHASRKWSELMEIVARIRLVIQNHQPHGWEGDISIPSEWIMPPWVLGSLQMIKDLGFEAYSLSFSPDGRYLAALRWSKQASAKEIVIFETEGWDQVRRFDVPQMDRANALTSLGGEMLYHLIRYTDIGNICVIASWFSDTSGGAYRMELRTDGDVFGPRQQVKLHRIKIIDLRPPDEFIYGPWKSVRYEGLRQNPGLSEGDWPNREREMGLRKVRTFSYHDEDNHDCVSFPHAESVAFCPPKALVAVADGWRTQVRKTTRIYAWR